ncbi:MAG: hypothetical protein IPJ84_15210 [Bdellovibrionales bacterium]|nr:hypothetical protein [Bdellovibrionales bacterium]
MFLKLAVGWFILAFLFRLFMSEPGADELGMTVGPSVISKLPISATFAEERGYNDEIVSCLNKEKVLGEIKNEFSIFGKFGFKCVEGIKDWTPVPMSRTAPKKKVDAKINYEKLSEYALEQISKEERFDFGKLSDADLEELEALEQRYGSGVWNGAEPENRLFSCENRRGLKLRVAYSTKDKCD